MEPVNVLLITQARRASTRLPDKILKTIDGKTLLQIQLNRLRKCKQVSRIVVATTVEDSDKLIYDKVKSWGFDCSRGSEQDVLDRYYQTAILYKPEYVVRVTSDCPLIDPTLVDDVIQYALSEGVDYCANTIVEHFPDGQDVEVFSFKALEYAWSATTESFEREHVTAFIRNNSTAKDKELFKSVNFPCEGDFSNIRMTVDRIEDFTLIERLVTDLGSDKSWREYVRHIVENHLSDINKGIIRNEAVVNYLKEENNG